VILELYNDVVSVQEKSSKLFFQRSSTGISVSKTGVTFCPSHRVEAWFGGKAAAFDLHMPGGWHSMTLILRAASRGLEHQKSAY
jgi:hypothetical protein